MTETQYPDDEDRPEPVDPAAVPDWEDEYLDRVSDRLMFNYDLERDYRAAGERFDMYGEFRIENKKQFLHESINWANHEAREHVFVRRTDHVSVADLERLVDLGHTVADDWIEANEEHYGTDFTFVVVASEIPDDVRSFVSTFADRTLIKYGYYGQYEIHLAVVAPDREDAVQSKNTDIGNAFALWGDVPDLDGGGLLTRLIRRITH
ncbi:hypothetical protein ACFQH6_00110 [Halobacteriaceae archaeon GCM10025711]